MTRTKSEQKIFRQRIETLRRENTLYYPVEEQAMLVPGDDVVSYLGLDAPRQAFVVANPALDVDLVLRVYAHDRLLTVDEFEQLFAEFEGGR